MKAAMHIQIGVDPLTLCRDDDDRRVINEKDHAAMMRRPWLWPLKTALPLKRRLDGDTQVGYITEGYKCGTFMITKGTIMMPDGSCLFYNNPEDAVDVGWRVD